MRPRAGTHPVTLEPPTVAEILALARQHDERLKDVRQDLFRAETKLRVEQKLKWPIRIGCVAIGAGGLAIAQNAEVQAQVVGFFTHSFSNIRTTGLATLITLFAIALALLGIGYLVRKWISGPTPEQKAQKLMEQFARADGVAAYVFSGQDTAEDEAATVDALVRPENKQMRQRRMTSSHRLLTASLTRLLN
ncbi:MAG: hypothetical protein ABMA14_25370, partial [Hyphomonadaceae bacterium]